MHCPALKLIAAIAAASPRGRDMLVLEPLLHPRTHAPSLQELLHLHPPHLHPSPHPRWCSAAPTAATLLVVIAGKLLRVRGVSKAGRLPVQKDLWPSSNQSTQLGQLVSALLLYAGGQGFDSQLAPF